MPSERRLHPWSLLFSLAGQARQFAVPLLLALFVGSRGDNMELWALPILVPYTIGVVVRFISFRYAFGDDELVIRSGLIFRNERHIPYARIQNLDAIQNALHRLLGVVDVRVDTGSGADVDAKLSVVTWPAYEEMRQRVLVGRAGVAAAPAGEGAPETPAGRTLLHLGPRDLSLLGIIENRAAVLVAAVIGLLWETRMFESAFERVFGDGSPAPRAARRFLAGWFRDGVISWSTVGMALAALVALIALLRIFSMIWAMVRLHDFRLTRIDDDLRTEYGLLTRVSATIPLRRVQTVTIRSGLIHRWFDRASLGVETAGGDGAERGSKRRESLAPIVGVDQLPSLLHEVLPELDLSSIDWQPPARRAFRREAFVRTAFAAIVAALSSWLIGKWAIAFGAVYIAWAVFAAWKYTSHLRWAVIDGAVLFESGWLSRHLSIARFSKIQAVRWHQTPFDRRHRMARLSVDTAGAGDAGHRVDIPYLSIGAAESLHGRLAQAAAWTVFKW